MNTGPKSSTADYLLFKFKPTLFGFLETQHDSALKKVLAYVYQDEINLPGGLTCRGPVFGSTRVARLADVTSEFDAYSYNPNLQSQLLQRVNEYVRDFKAATISIPTDAQMSRLLEVQSYFQDKTNAQPTISRASP